MNQLFVLVLYCNPKILSQDAVGFAVVMLIMQPFTGPTVFAGHFCGHVDVVLYPGQSNSKHCTDDFAPANVVFPTAHAVHALAPVRFECVPPGHKTHALAPGSTYEPTGHTAQTLALVAATTPEYAPAGHDIQTLAPVTDEYVPAGQFMHAVDVTDEYVPDAHFVHTLAPCIEIEPAAQAIQPVFPIIALNFPASHAVHGPPSGPL